MSVSNGSSKDASLARLDRWIEQLEEKAQALLAAFLPDELEPAQAANLALKYIGMLGRMMELRQQFVSETTSHEQRLIELILGEVPQARTHIVESEHQHEDSTGDE